MANQPHQILVQSLITTLAQVGKCGISVDGILDKIFLYSDYANPNGATEFDVRLDGVSIYATTPERPEIAASGHSVLQTGLGLAVTQGQILTFHTTIIQTGGIGNYLIAQALVTEPDVLASTTEVLTGTNATKAVTPDALAALWEQGPDIASAATISIGEGSQFNVTGTTTITDIDPATDKAGRTFWLKFAGILTLTNGASLILPTGANITTAVGDVACFRSEGSDVVRCLTYQRADGTALVGSATAASTTDVLTGTNTTKAVTPDALAALWEQGADIASAATTTIGEGGYFKITGTTTITDIDPATDKAGRAFWLRFSGILILTHNASTLILPTGASITTAVGDTALFISEGADAVRCVAYIRADGTPLAGGGGGGTAASTTEVLTGTDSTKFATPDAIAALWEQGSNIASAATISVGEGGYFHITGTTTITDIDPATDKAGREFCLVFDGILTLTHNGSTLILPGGANITTAAGDMAVFRSEGSDVVRCVSYQRANGSPLVASSSSGKQTIWIPAVSMIPATTNGPSVAQLESSTNKVNYGTLDFDGTTGESAHFNIAMPKGWDEGTISFQVWWTTTNTGTAGVAWGLQGIAASDGDTVDTAFGTAIYVTDAGQSSAAKMYVSAESAAVTIGGSPAEGDLCFFKFSRDPSNGSDTMTEDARLVGIKVFYTTNTSNDA